MTTLDKGTGDTDDEEKWLPFGIEDQEVAAFTALREDVPPWLEQSLWGWVGSNVIAQSGGRQWIVRTELLRKAERVLHVTLPVIPAHRVSNALDELRTAYRGQPARAVLALVDFLAAELEPGDLRLDDLEHLLIEAGSGWRVGTRRGKPGLVRRLPDGVTKAATATFKRGDAGQRLATAWEAAFGLHPDPSNAYRIAVKAVEDAAIPVICPNDKTATLGKVIGYVDQGTWQLPHLREDPIAKTHDVLVSMLRMLWVGQHDRHGGPSAVGVPAVTQEEAESAVTLAVTLVGWFETGKVQQ
jgi:hypothetical protein